MPEGQIIRALSGFYYVEEAGNVWECKARGIFKKKNRSPLVGDKVFFDVIGQHQGIITEIKPRKNQLHRPPVSNIDQAVLVFSAVQPDFSRVLLDKFLVHVERAKIKPIICVTKTDLLTKIEDLEKKLSVYREIGYQVVKTSKYGQGLNELADVLKGKISVFAGQSGVGKSTLLNTLIPHLQLETAKISHKLGRGKHTTRVVQLISLPEGGMVADTPGFSQLDFQDIVSTDLANYFIEFDRFVGECRFRGCMHLNEPGCAVKSAVSEKKIDEDRYRHYVEFLEEIQENEAKKWR